MHKWLQHKHREAGEGAQVTFSAGFPFDFLGKLSGKIANGKQIMWGAAAGLNYELITKCSDHGYVIVGLPGWPEL